MLALAVIGALVVVGGVALAVGFWLYRTEDLLDDRRMMDPQERARQRALQEVATGLCLLALLVLVIGAFVYDGCRR
jgi:uncharacterized membrane protein